MISCWSTNLKVGEDLQKDKPGFDTLWLRATEAVFCSIATSMMATCQQIPPRRDGQRWTFIQIPGNTVECYRRITYPSSSRVVNSSPCFSSILPFDQPEVEEESEAPSYFPGSVYATLRVVVEIVTR